jgi:hypothetical protein
LYVIREIEFSLEGLTRPSPGGSAHDVYLIVAGMLGEARISRVFPEEVQDNRYSWRMTPGRQLRPAKVLVRRRFEDYCEVDLRIILARRVTLQYLDALILASQIAASIERLNRFIRRQAFGVNYPSLKATSSSDKVIGDFTLAYDVVDDLMQGMLIVGPKTRPSVSPSPSPRPGVSILECDCYGIASPYRVAIGIAGPALGPFSCSGPGLSSL